MKTRSKYSRPVIKLFRHTRVCHLYTGHLHAVYKHHFLNSWMFMQRPIRCADLISCKTSGSYWLQRNQQLYGLQYAPWCIGRPWTTTPNQAWYLYRIKFRNLHFRGIYFKKTIALFPLKTRSTQSSHTYITPIAKYITWIIIAHETMISNECKINTSMNNFLDVCTNFWRIITSVLQQQKQRQQHGSDIHKTKQKNQEKQKLGQRELHTESRWTVRSATLCY